MKTTERFIERLYKKVISVLILIVLIFLVSTLNGFAQNKNSVAVTLIDANGIDYSSEDLSNLVRLELEKVSYFTVMDKYEMFERFTQNEFDYKNCFGQSCLIEAGKLLEVDRILSGNIEVISDKIVISLRLIDVSNETISKSNIMEYIDREPLLDRMIEASIKDLLGIEIEQEILDQLNKDEDPIAPEITYYKLNGPRLGVAYITGEIGAALQAPKSKGGYDGYPVLSQIGYQYEAQYMGAGNFIALIEVLFMVSGLEQQLLIPSMVFTNGFRLNKQGWEFAFGPSINVSKKAMGFYDYEDVPIMGGDPGEWYLENEYNEVFPGSPNEFEDYLIERMDSRGDVKITTGWIWAVGKTFHSGYLNIPVNVYVSPKKEGWYIGLSVGFNMAKKSSRQ